MLVLQQVLQKAICPEKRAGLDSALSAIASVTEVRVSNDLQVAKVYISIFSDERGKETAMRQLNKLQGCAVATLTVGVTSYSCCFTMADLLRSQVLSDAGSASHRMKAQ